MKFIFVDSLKFGPSYKWNMTLIWAQSEKKFPAAAGRVSLGREPMEATAAAFPGNVDADPWKSLEKKYTT